MKLNYNNIRDYYEKNGSEILDILYYHYYYIILKIYNNNNKTIAIKLIEDELRNILINYLHNGEKSHNPSKFIHEQMNKFVSNYKFLELKRKDYDLTIEAYNGNKKARGKFFYKESHRIDDKVNEIYDFYTAKDKNFDLIYDDLKCIMYCDMWDFTNRFYDRENKGYYFSTGFITHLRDLSNRVNKYIKNNRFKDLYRIMSDYKVKEVEEILREVKIDGYVLKKEK